MAQSANNLEAVGTPEGEEMNSVNELLSGELMSESQFRHVTSAYWDSVLRTARELHLDWIRREQSEDLWMLVERET